MLLSLQIKTDLLSKVFDAMKKNGLSKDNLDLLNSLKEIKSWNEHKDHIDLVELLETFEKEDGFIL